ncbi:MAG: diaminopimelate epimerase [Deltaproteobacteria bacterium]|nr:diaminopimelate epimerase [Deltaproteobacteria bacterium]
MAARDLRFRKFHGLGNDFIVLEDVLDALLLSAEGARRLCDRHRGIGADGILTLLRPRIEGADYRLHIYNRDGSVPEMCGNGLRCVMRHVADRMRCSSAVFDTDAGLRRGSIEGEGDRNVRVGLGDVRLLASESQLLESSPAVEGVGLSLGNPHLVLRPLGREDEASGSESIPGASLLMLAQRLGPELERHPRFPDRTNVGFLRLMKPQTIELVVFERGAGLTQACGTGAAAAATAACRWGLVCAAEPVVVHLPGGALEVRVEPFHSASTGGLATSEAGSLLGHVELVGDAQHVFDGAVWVEGSDLARSVD